jgi:hypothetical protein
MAPTRTVNTTAAMMAMRPSDIAERQRASKER